MEKFKNMIHSGSKKETEASTSSNPVTDPLHTTSSKQTTSGQGSHFGSGRTAAHDAAISAPTAAGSASHDTNTLGSHNLQEPYSSQMPGQFGDDDDAATTASVKSGVPGSSQSGGNILARHDEPSLSTQTPSSTNPTAMGQASTGSGPLSGAGTGSSLTGTSLPVRSGGSSGYGDSSTTTSENPSSGRSFPLGGNSDTGPSTTYAPGQIGTYPAGGRAAPVHSSSIANTVDPRVDSASHDAGQNGSAGPHSNIDSTTGFGHAGTQGHGSALTGTADRVDYNSGAGISDHRDMRTENTTLPAGAGGRGSMGYGPESWGHEHGTHGHQYSGDPCLDLPPVPGPHIVSGPHATDTANRLDPRVGSGSAMTGASSGSATGHGVGGYRGTDTGSTGSTTAIGSTGSSSTSHPERNMGLTGGSSSAGVPSYEAERKEPGSRDYASTGNRQESVTTGPHKSALLNKLDPRVDSDNSKQQSTANAGREPSLVGTNTNSSTRGDSAPYSSSSGAGQDHGLSQRERMDPHSSTVDREPHHYGRDAAIGATGGAAAYGADSRLHGHGSTMNTSSGATSTNPYSGGVDPRINTPVTGNTSLPVETPRAGYAPGTVNSERDSQTATGPHHHHHHHGGRDAAIAGTGGVGAYEAEKHAGNRGDMTGQDRLPHSNYQSTDPATNLSSSQNSQSETGHHHGRDAAIAGTGGLGAYEAEKHAGSHGNMTGQDRLPHSSHQSTDPTTNLPSSQAPIAGSSGHHGGFVDQRRADGPVGAGVVHDSQATAGQDQHRGRDAALAGGAGAGAGALAGHELSKKEAEKEHKAHVKEEKALEKEHAKEIKHHDKVLAKEEHTHEKAIEKDEKKHEKAIEKDEKKHEKAVAADMKHHDEAVAAEEKKHDKHDGEKKHGGLLGFLHRDKSDKTLKEEQAERQASPESTNLSSAGHHSSPESANLSSHRPGDDERSTGVTGGAPGTEEGVTGSGEYDSPISSGPTTHAAYGSHEGHNKLHKDPPAKVLEARGLK